MAASEAAKEAIYLRSFLDELGQGDVKPTRLAVDNQAAQDLAYNPEHHQRTKHIQRRHFFVRERVESLEISVPFVRSEHNMADFFTKPLPSSTFFRLRDAIMNVPPGSARTTVSSTGGCRNTCVHKGTLFPKSSVQVDTVSAPASLYSKGKGAP